MCVTLQSEVRRGSACNFREFFDLLCFFGEGDRFDRIDRGDRGDGFDRGDRGDRGMDLIGGIDLIERGWV